MLLAVPLAVPDPEQSAWLQPLSVPSPSPALPRALDGPSEDSPPLPQPRWRMKMGAAEVAAERVEVVQVVGAEIE